MKDKQTKINIFWGTNSCFHLFRKMIMKFNQFWINQMRKYWKYQIFWIKIEVRDCKIYYNKKKMWSIKVLKRIQIFCQRKPIKIFCTLNNFKWIHLKISNIENHLKIRLKWRWIKCLIKHYLNYQWSHLIWNTKIK